jgi:hypothetical protein
LERLGGQRLSNVSPYTYFRPLTVNKADIEGRDNDTRPGLGLTYWEDDQPYQTWEELLSSKPHRLPDEFITTKWAEEVDKMTTDTMVTDAWLSEQWTPDVDARTRESVDQGYNARVTRYYDSELQPIEYELNMAPSEVQLYFYPRRGTTMCAGVYSEHTDNHPYNTHQECVEYFTGEEGPRHIAPPNALTVWNGSSSTHRMSAVRYIMGGDTRTSGVDQHLDDGNFYISFLDWGDGTKVQYDGTDAPPHQLLSYDNAQLLKHNYKKPGIYTITGYMLNRMDHTSTPKSCGSGRGFITWGQCYDPSVGGNPEYPTDQNLPDTWDSPEWDYKILTFRKFELNIVVNVDPDLANEFPAVGGAGNITIPQKGTTAIVGGISKDSMYAASLKRMAGFVGDNTRIENTFLSAQGDRMLAERSYGLIDEEALGAEAEKFTGVEDQLEYRDSATPTGIDLTKGFWSGTCAHNWISGGPLIDMHDRFTGGFRFQHNHEYASTYCTSPMNYYIYMRGYKNDNTGELGRHIGYMDIGQVRAFTGVRTMADLLDVPDVAIDNKQHWTNILPSRISIYDRQGVVTETIKSQK